MMETRQSTIEAELKAGHSVTYFTVGRSMRPLLSQRETLVTIVPAHNIRKWDILLYRREGGQYILHRLITIKNGRYYIRGDNTYSLEEVFPEQVLGVVTHIFHRGRVLDVKKDTRYRCYVWLWCTGYPLRHMYIQVLGKIRYVLRKRDNHNE